MNCKATIWWVRALALFTMGFLVCSPSFGAAPRIYVTAQAGVFQADAGTTRIAEWFPANDDPIKSGTKFTYDISVGAKIRPWLSLELGYVGFEEFRSDVFRWDDGIPFVPTAQWRSYDLSALRLTTVIHLYARNGLRFSLLGGIIHSTGGTTWHDDFQPSLRGPVSFDAIGYNYGADFSYEITRRAGLALRVVRYEFGSFPLERWNVTSMNCSLGFAWRF